MADHKEDLIEGIKFLLFLTILINGLFWLAREINRRINENDDYNYQRCLNAGFESQKCYREFIWDID